MASLMNLFLAYFLVSINGLANAGRVFKVGDELGWKEPEGNSSNFYIHWAESNRFRIGDSLLFEYQNDSVVEVDKWGYFHCNTTNQIIGFNNGKSVFNLDKSGLFFFISGNTKHCRNGQRVIVEVMGPHHQNSPPSTSSPPEYYDDLAPSPNNPLKQSSGSSPVSARIGSVSSVVVLAASVAFVGSA